MTEKVYTILELNTAVRDVIRNSFSNYVWVCGEIQDLRASRDKKHIYFSLVQKQNSQDAIVAKVNVAIFQGRKVSIFKKLADSSSDFKLQEDIEVKLLCNLDLYPKTGNFSLIVVDIDPIYTLGKIAQNRQKIIENLRKNGFLEKNKLKEIAEIPLNLGLITSYDSAAYHDFTNELVLSNYGFKVSAYNCHMQGKLVEQDLLDALGFFNGLSSSELDVIIVTRGGGSTADLSYFDNRKIAEAIAKSKFPVISAIGHQINTTIVDMVAHTFCKTPTKAAQFLVERISSFMDNLGYIQDKIFRVSQDLIANRKKELQITAQKSSSLVSMYFRIQSQELLEKKHNILHVTTLALASRKQILLRNFDIVKSTSDKILKHFLYGLKHIKSKIKLLDPRNILKRGYSITYKDEKAVKSIKDVAGADLIKTVVYDGDIFSTVKIRR